MDGVAVGDVVFHRHAGVLAVFLDEVQEAFTAAKALINHVDVGLAGIQHGLAGFVHHLLGNGFLGGFWRRGFLAFHRFHRDFGGLLLLFKGGGQGLVVLDQGFIRLQQDVDDAPVALRGVPGGLAGILGGVLILGDVVFKALAVHRADFLEDRLHFFLCGGVTGQQVVVHPVKGGRVAHIRGDQFHRQPLGGEQLLRLGAGSGLGFLGVGGLVILRVGVDRIVPLRLGLRQEGILLILVELVKAHVGDFLAEHLAADEHIQHRAVVGFIADELVVQKDRDLIGHLAFCDVDPVDRGQHWVLSGGGGFRQAWKGKRQRHHQRQHEGEEFFIHGQNPFSLLCPLWHTGLAPGKQSVPSVTETSYGIRRPLRRLLRHPRQSGCAGWCCGLPLPPGGS